MAAQRDTAARADRRVILHFGVQKTASTSLHHFLHRNRAALAPHLSVRTPQKGSAMRELGRAALRFSLDPGAEAETHLGDRARALRDDLVGGAPVALLSHENLPGAMIGKDGVVTLYPLLERIITVIEANFAPFQPEYVFYTRDMAAWKVSVYNQAVKSDHYPRTFDRFLTETVDCGTWDGLQARMHALVGAARVRFFALEDEVDPARPGQQLLRHAGLSAKVLDDLSPMAGRSNQALNTGALEFLRRINALGLERKVRAQLAELVASNQSLFVSG